MSGWILFSRLRDALERPHQGRHIAPFQEEMNGIVAIQTVGGGSANGRRLICEVCFDYSATKLYQLAIKTADQTWVIVKSNFSVAVSKILPLDKTSNLNANSECVDIKSFHPFIEDGMTNRRSIDISN
ncbi:hypothetical protein ACTXT7_016295 [Hymenolepis weldensis]